MAPAPTFSRKLPLSIGLAAALWGFGAVGPAAAAEKSELGALLPGGSREVGQERYRSPEGFEETLKFYSKTYSVDHFPRHRIADLPGVRAVHLENSTRFQAWEGLNIYELNGETRIFVVPRVQPPKSHRHR